MGCAYYRPPITPGFLLPGKSVHSPKTVFLPVFLLNIIVLSKLNPNFLRIFWGLPETVHAGILQGMCVVCTLNCADSDSDSLAWKSKFSPRLFLYSQSGSPGELGFSMLLTLRLWKAPCNGRCIVWTLECSELFALSGGLHFVWETALHDISLPNLLYTFLHFCTMTSKSGFGNLTECCAALPSLEPPPPPPLLLVW